jgi:hypothetical protein
MKLADGGTLLRAMGFSIDHKATAATDPFPAVMLKSNRLLAFALKLLIQHIQHLQKRHMLGDIGNFIADKFSGSIPIFLTPDI